MRFEDKVFLTQLCLWFNTKCRKASIKSNKLLDTLQEVVITNKVEEVQVTPYQLVMKGGDY